MFGESNVIKFRYVITVILFALSVFGLFQIKFSVQALHAEVAELKKQLEHEQNSIHILKAEWAYLNQPERLQKLAEKYLNLRELQHDQIMITQENCIIVAQQKVTYEQQTDFIPASMKKNLSTATPTKFSPIKWRYKERPDIRNKKKE
jgi:cell division protein FtsL